MEEFGYPPKFPEEIITKEVEEIKVDPSDPTKRQKKVIIIYIILYYIILYYIMALLIVRSRVKCRLKGAGLVINGI